MAKAGYQTCKTTIAGSVEEAISGISGLISGNKYWVPSGCHQATSAGHVESAWVSWEDL